MNKIRMMSVLIILAMIFSFASVSPALAASYIMTDLGTFGGNSSQATAINEAGQVIGYAETAGGQRHAFVWDSGVMTDLGTLGGGQSHSIAINEAGQVIGNADTAGGQQHAFVWQGGVMTDLGTFGGSSSQATAINEAGQVIGSSYVTGDASIHAFVWDGGVLTDMGTLGGSYSFPVAINEAGQVIGISWVAGDDSYHGFVWDGGVMTDLGTFGGGYSRAHDINEAGQVVGISYLAGNAEQHAFLWEGGVMTDLGTLGGSYSNATAINEAGQVIGASWVAGDASIHAFVWDGVVMTDLGTLGGRNSHSIAINEAGQVIGYFDFADIANPHNGVSYHGFVWDGGVITDLGTLGGSDSYAVAINQAGQVAGNSYASGYTGNHAFVWEGGVMTDLGTLGRDHSYTVAINEAGQVIGNAVTAGGQPHAFVAIQAPGNTPLGTNVAVQPVDTTTSATPVTLTFTQVTQGGETSLTTSSSGPPPPVGFKLGSPPIYYELTTTAVFSGIITLCIDYTGTSFESDPTLTLRHLEGGSWVDRTVSLDTVNHIICGDVTSFSPFAIFESAYQFSGFFQPVDNPPTLNSVNAGRAIPVKFSLGGDQGLNIFAVGYPSSQQISCSTNMPIDVVEETLTAGSSSLTYNPDSDQYHYVWKTEKSWAGMCRQLVVKFIDGTTQRANFKFK